MSKSHTFEVGRGIGRMFLNIDRVTGAFVRAGNLLEVLQDWTKLNGIKDIDTEKLQFHDKIQVKRFLKGLILTISVRDPNEHLCVFFHLSLHPNSTSLLICRCSKIKDVSKLSANTYVFKGPEDKEMNVRHYLETKFQMRLKHPNLPLVQITKTAWYPLEMCSVVFGRNFFSRLNPLQVGDLMKTRCKLILSSLVSVLTSHSLDAQTWTKESSYQVIAGTPPYQRSSSEKLGNGDERTANADHGQTASCSEALVLQVSRKVLPFVHYPKAEFSALRKARPKRTSHHQSTGRWLATSRSTSNNQDKGTKMGHCRVCQRWSKQGALF